MLIGLLALLSCSALAERCDDGWEIVFSSGPVPKEQASHAVLWTKRSFEGDIRIEYDYTHIAKLRKKIEDDPSDPEHLITVHRLGYKLVG